MKMLRLPKSNYETEENKETSKTINTGREMQAVTDR
jgi:hypothetical protein